MNTGMFTKKNPDTEVAEGITDIIRRIPPVPSMVDPRPRIVETQPVAPRKLTPTQNVAGWAKNLTYEDMMQMSSELHSLKGDDQLDSPDKIAKLIHLWASGVMAKYDAEVNPNND